MYLPLITVFVITYNSSETIIEALESVKNQTYPNIELIISDDCSSDETITICKDWIEKNKNSFSHVKIVTSSYNTGTAPNCNRAIKASSGVWLKVLAGDDKLLPTCLEENYKYALIENETDIIFSKTHFFGVDKDFVAKVKSQIETEFYPKIKLNQKKQYYANLKDFYLPGPTIFFSRKLYDQIKGYDENYPFNEEDSFAFRLLEKGYHIKFLDKELYSYRVDHNSLCRGENKSIHYKGREKFYWEVRRAKLKEHRMYYDIWRIDSHYKYMSLKGEDKILYKIYIKSMLYLHPSRWCLIPKRLKKLFL